MLLANIICSCGGNGVCYCRGMSITDTIPRPDPSLPLSEVVRRNVRAAIVRAGYTQGVFSSSVIRKNQSWLSRRIRQDNPTEFTVDDLQLIATALNITPEDLLHR